MNIKLKLLFFLGLAVNLTFAQVDYLAPIGGNALLKQYEVQEKASYSFNNFVFQTDTLTLPFVDDFSSNTLLPRDYSQLQITDTVEFIAGTCVENGDFDLRSDSFNINQTFDYNFDTALMIEVATPKASVQIEFYNSLACFDAPAISATFYPQAYSFTYDSTTGAKIDSALLPADTLITNATAYFANLNPNGKWQDNYAFYNTTFPINPPTIGVATLDGLNEFGRPYNNSVINPVGHADVLTSKPIDLSGLTNNSDVFISFFVQAQGNGDAPNTQDSLVLEFKNEYENLWVKAWGITIDDLAPGDFKQFYVAVRDTNLVTGPRYFYEDYQFRFRNIASLSGNNDHWHIDYVRLDSSRAIVEQDTVIRDVAFMYDYPNALQKYSTLPWSQFQAGADEFADTLEIPIRDNGQLNGLSAGSFPIEILVTDSLDTDTVFKLSGLTFNPTSEIKALPLKPNLDYVKPNFEGDSICMNSGMGMYPTSRNLLFENDTTFSQICFNKVMAYDDGTAERAYGLSGSSNEIKKFAYKFEVAHPDTLAGIQVHFSNIDEDVSDLVFSFYAWDSLELDIPLSFENQIGIIENAKPAYVDIQNGFVTFAFDSPILVTNTFYIGWAQTDTRNLQIGYDVNSVKGRENMFTYTGSTWRASNIGVPGSPMIRALLDADFTFDPPTGIRNITRNTTIKVYPNPNQGVFTVEVPNKVQEYHINVFDYTGKLVFQSTNQRVVDIQEMNAGIYLIQTNIDGKVFQAKVLKQ